MHDKYDIEYLGVINRKVLQVCAGALLGFGQVFGVTSMAASVLMWIGSIFCSPLLTILMLLGSFLGTLVGVNSQIYILSREFFEELRLSRFLKCMSGVPVPS